MYVDCRSTGAHALQNWLSGWRPKSPDQRHRAIEEFLLGLSDVQRAQLQSVFEYFLDLSFFNLLVRFEQGEGPWSFDLHLHNSVTGETAELVGRSADRDLRGEFLDAVEAAGTNNRA
jgi:hypothetical protein